MARRIKFTSSGGIAGQIRGCEIPSEELPAKAAGSLSRLLKAKSAPKPTPEARDAMQYDLEIVEDDGTRRNLSFGEAALPAAAEPLIEFLNSKATWRPPE